MTSDIFVARQPIFDADRRVAAYELLFRGGRLSGVGDRDSEGSAVRMLNNTVLGLGLEALLGDKPGVLAIPHEVMVGGAIDALPKDRIILHVTTHGNDDHELVPACREATAAGFQVAVSSTNGPPSDELVSLASFVHVDFRRLDPDARRETTARRPGPGTRMVAKHLTSYAEFHEAREAGFDRFQGPFFCEPEVFSGRDLSTTSHSLAQLIAEVNRPDLDMDRLEQIIKRDVALSLKLLRYLNSASLGWRHEVSTIGQALRILGQRATRKWASLVAMTMIPADKPPELVTTSLIRGQFCEEIGALRLGEARRPELFLVGLLSVLDALFDRPMPLLLSEMALARECSDALLGEPSPLTDYLQLVVAYDQGDWDQVDDLCARTSLAPELLPEGYHKTLAWVGEVVKID